MINLWCRRVCPVILLLICCGTQALAILTVDCGICVRKGNGTCSGLKGGAWCCSAARPVRDCLDTDTGTGDKACTCGRLYCDVNPEDCRVCNRASRSDAQCASYGLTTCGCTNCCQRAVGDCKVSICAEKCPHTCFKRGTTCADCQPEPQHARCCCPKCMGEGCTALTTCEVCRCCTDCVQSGPG